jgi:hypothetical protein
MTGTCGTCGRDAEATGENEGYSYCCNDRIEYGIEAEETKERIRREALGELECWNCDEWSPPSSTKCTRCGTAW